jgi:hypothetical protein
LRRSWGIDSTLLSFCFLLSRVSRSFHALARRRDSSERTFFTSLPLPIVHQAEERRGRVRARDGRRCHSK